MENVFGKLKIHKKYDLKGSTVDRQAKGKEKGATTKVCVYVNMCAAWKVFVHRYLNFKVR